ncbi:MAG: nitroreductase [Firmicutes bacterium]|nr:nitroreductase [Bacillota bacterium]
MEVRSAIEGRKSIRGFLPDKVDKAVIEDILKMATWAISAENSQPWEMAVVTGDVLKKIAEDNEAALNEGLERSGVHVPAAGIYKPRAVEVGKMLFGAMEITREDKEKRNWWVARGFRFFDAPVGIILYIDKYLDEKCYRFDVGCLAQNITLAAMEHGLGTCVAYQPVEFERGIRKHLGLSDEKTLVVAVALGYPDPDFPANNVRTPRLPLDEVTTWYGFDE